jgi:predicted Zn-dependent protease
LHQTLLENVRRYAEAFFGLPVRIAAPQPLPTALDGPARQQYSAHALIDHLRRSRPDDALAYVGIVDVDLHAASLHFVFGMGDIDSRIGAYSLARLLEEDYSARSLRRVLGWSGTPASTRSRAIGRSPHSTARWGSPTRLAP